MTKEKDPQTTGAAVNVQATKSIYDFLESDHPTFKRVLIALGVIFAIVAAYFISWVLPVFFLLALGAGWLVFRNAFWSEDTVRVVTAYEDDPSRLDMLLIGKRKFQDLNSSGVSSPLATSSGNVIFVADDFSGKELSFPWVYGEDVSRLEFILKREAFDTCRKLAEDSSHKLYALRNIPNVLALSVSSKYIQKYEKFYNDILTGEDIEKVAAAAMSEIENVDSQEDDDVEVI